MYEKVTHPDWRDIPTYASDRTDAKRPADHLVKCQHCGRGDPHRGPYDIDKLLYEAEQKIKQMKPLHDAFREYMKATGGEVPGNSDYWKEKFRAAIST